MVVNKHIADTAHRAFMDPAELDAATAFWVRFLDVLHGFPEVRANHRRIVDLLGLRSGSSLLDVGCGTGNFTRDAAPIVSPGGRVTGCDHSEAMLGVANTRAAEAGLAIDYHVGDAMALPFADASFDAARIERVLQYLDRPEQAVAEMVRVTKPGGRIAATEADWDGFSSDLGGLDRGIWRRAIMSISDGAGNGWQGREIRRLFVDAGLEDVTCEGVIVIVTDARTVLEDLAGRVSIERARDAGAISELEAEQLVAAVWELDRAGQYTFGIPLYTVSGRVPVASQ
jgi:SAM-dependent methyltransferase